MAGNVSNPARRPLGAVAALAAVGLALLGAGAARRAEARQVEIQPSLDGGVAWFNVAGPIRLEQLRGKVVLLDFWTYCCINCHHVLPDLARLEEKYKNELVVIGVHTPKFPAERDADNIRKKIAEYRIRHPVVSDVTQAIWERFQVSSWPTLVLIDPRGRYIGFVAGEGKYDILDKVIGQLVAKHRAAGDLDESPLHFAAEVDKPDEGPLLFPGKVLADAEGKRLFIADTGHNRVVVTDLDGQLVAAIGSGEAGKADGGFAKATFNRPQGMLLHDGTLYVADTENHAIRAVDLTKQSVSTVAGTGQQGHLRRGPAKTTALNSPWDLAPMPGSKHVLAIAMAGPHQLWTLDLKANTVGAWAGDGNENIADGTLATASFAQPSGLASDGKHLFVADSEGSCVREVHVAQGRVGTLAGQHDVPGVLFSYGDEDGKGTAVRLQHCLGVAYADGKLYVADTYNNKIKVIDSANLAVKTLAGNREGGKSDSPPTFDQPGGLSVGGKTLYIADANNHAIRALDLASGKVRTLALKGVTPPSPPRPKPKFPRATVVDLPAAKAAPGGEVALQVEIPVPAGFKLNTDPGATPLVLVEAPDKPGALGAAVPEAGQKIEPQAKFRLPVPLARPAAAGETLKLRVSLRSFVCREGNGALCTIKDYVWNVPVEFAADAPAEVTIAAPAPEAAPATRGR